MKKEMGNEGLRPARVRKIWIWKHKKRKNPNYFLPGIQPSQIVSDAQRDNSCRSWATPQQQYQAVRGRYR